VTEPRRVGRYVLGPRLGSGGMAEVMRAHSPGLGLARQEVALKLMHHHLADDPEFVRLFFREAQVASSLRHPNVVNVLESGEDDGTYYLAMELVEGPTLRQLIRAHQGEPFDIQAAVSIVCAVCEGLHHAHERTGSDGTPLCIVHRDVSPGNVLLSSDGTVKLSDFGVATATAAWTSLRSTTGSIRGKIAYMAPEQARGHGVDRRADVFSIANVLYELIEGHRLLQAKGEVELLHELLFAGFGDGRPTRDDCPPALSDVIAQALAGDPDERPPSARAFADALRSACPPMDASALGRYVARFAAAVPAPSPKPSVTAPPAAEPDTETGDLEPPAPAAPTATLHLEPPPSPAPRRSTWPAIAGVLLAGAAAAAWLWVPASEPPRTASVHLSFPPLASSAAAEDPPNEPTPSTEEPAPEPVVAVPEDPPAQTATPPTSRRKSKRPRKRKRRGKGSSLAKPPPNESLFPK